jgi:isoleucyl-tRNA synthetase
VSAWDRLLAVREEVLKAIEQVRARGEIGNSLEAEVILDSSGDLAALLRRYADILRFVFIVSKVTLGPVQEPGAPPGAESGLRIGVRRAPGTKCERCWNVTQDVGSERDWPTICARCARAVRSIGAAGGPHR